MSPSSNINILFISDIVGRLGRKITKDALPQLKKKLNIDLTIANGENAAAGYGITEKVYNELVETGIDAITMGNHMFDKKDCASALERCPKIVRPANYPPGVPGKDHLIIETAKGKVAVINLLGRVFMQAVDCPFRVGAALIDKIKGDVPAIIVDIHAEATSEKYAIGYYLDGKASAVLGTHTHVMTADEQIMAQGTAYISDAGMTGAHDSVIGMEKDKIIARFLTQMPHRFEPVTTGEGVLNAVYLSVDPKTGKAKEIKRIFEIIPSAD